MNLSPLLRRSGLTVALRLSTAGAAGASEWTIDADHSSPQFSVTT
jgi:hypothetical protein